MRNVLNLALIELIEVVNIFGAENRKNLLQIVHLPVMLYELKVLLSRKISLSQNSV